MAQNKKKLKYYNSISNLPIFNWYMVYQKGNFDYLKKDLDAKLPKNMDIFELYSRIYDEFRERFGNSEKENEYYILMKEGNALLAESIDDRSKQTFAEIAYQKAKDIQKNYEGGDLLDSIGAVSEFLHSFVNIHTTMTDEFFLVVKTMENRNKINKK